MKLFRLNSATPVVDSQGRPTSAFLTGLQGALQDIETQVTDIQTALTNAGIALNHANAVMPDIAPVTITADYTGTILSGQLPRNIQATRLDDTTNVTASSTWSATTVSGSATYTIGAATGIINVTGIVADTVIEATSVFNSITRSKRVLVRLVLQDPPPSSSTTTAYDSSIDPTSSASYGTANSGILTITCGASTQVALTAPLTMQTTTNGSYAAWGKWQVSASGAGVWSDVAAEIKSTAPVVVSGGVPVSEGSIKVNETATGLTAGTAYDFRLLLRNDIGTETIYYDGTATATTS